MEKNKPSSHVKLLGKEYYTVDELSKYFGVSHDLIVHFIKNGTIKTTNMGNQRMLIPKKDFNQGTREMLEYLLSSPIDKKTAEGRINPIYTFWIFGLGMGFGSWLISGQLSDFITGAIMGFFIWFVLLTLLGRPAMKICKWIKEKTKKPNLL